MTYPMSPAFSAVAPHYDALMRGVPYDQWVIYIDRLLARCDVAPARVLDLACGTGNVAELLAKRGLSVVGVDISEDMICQAARKAERRGLEIDYRVQDAAELAVDGEPFDVCVSLFDSLNYILEPDRLAAAIHRVFAHLRPGGAFIFDVNSEFALANGFFDQDNSDTLDRLRYVWRSTFDEASRLCTVDMRFFVRQSNGVDSEFRETHVQYGYREEELRDMLCDAGFEQPETFHRYTLRPVTRFTDRIFFVARRPSNPCVD